MEVGSLHQQLDDAGLFGGKQSVPRRLDVVQGLGDVGGFGVDPGRRRRLGDQRRVAQECPDAGGDRRLDFAGGDGLHRADVSAYLRGL